MLVSTFTEGLYSISKIRYSDLVVDIDWIVGLVVDISSTTDWIIVDLVVIIIH